MVPSQENVTKALVAAAAGDSAAADDLWRLIYDELHRIAHRHLARERSDHTLSTTALVHEAYLRLVDQGTTWQSRGHFYAVASRIFRRILVDHARERGAQKRGAGLARVTLDEKLIRVDERLDELLALDEALDRLSVVDERLARLVECRYFGGLTDEEIAESFGLSDRTVRRDWVKAKGLLLALLDPDEGAGRGSGP
jgi:RNA polymerase sigma factor (TIGR02999 family)